MTEDRLKWIIDGLDFERLNSWEERFVEACEKGFKKYGNITEPMETKLEEIYREKSR
jgi:hypothetical protein